MIFPPCCETWQSSEMYPVARSTAPSQPGHRPAPWLLLGCEITRDLSFSCRPALDVKYPAHPQVANLCRRVRLSRAPPLTGPRFSTGTDRIQALTSCHEAMLPRSSFCFHAHPNRAPQCLGRGDSFARPVRDGHRLRDEFWTCENTRR